MSERILRFMVYDKYNLSDDHAVSVRYCGCERPEMCSFNNDVDDLNECDDTKIHDCEHDCLNFVGSYICSCHAGYSLNEDNRTCSDINECHGDTHVCTKQHEMCQNLPGNYSCVCDTGYSRSTLDADCNPTASSVLFGKLSYSIETSININISRVEKEILLQNAGIDAGQLSNGNPLIELLRQLGCAPGQTKNSRSGLIDDVGANKIP
ncbi:epidermal growth factor-like protein 6 isoform X2 [Dreissena polymorpha]|uniref:epidermal growth factor-like protein 6 isoform X2 n=1 Tax=Dreissena polymorpha TaxID=45954 RepID=UPI002263D2FB|nr:epidermal growth factor-like protein 6 isoform X2 [Dreissena polymorpha]